jgi:hypothetical protein
MHESLCRPRWLAAATLLSIALCIPSMARGASSLPAGFVIPYLGYGVPTCDAPHTCSGGDGSVVTLGSEPQVSPDGKFVYDVADTGRIDWVPTSSNGFLEADAAGCIATSGCTVAIRGITVGDIALSPDGHVLVATGPEGIAVFSRNAGTGALTQLAGTSGCLTETAVAGCATVRGISAPIQPTFAPDGSALYVIGAWGDDVASFAVGPTGALTQPAGTAACIAASGVVPDDGCAVALDASFSPFTLLVVDQSLYVRSAGIDDDWYDVLDEAPVGGELTQMAAPAGCFNRDGSAACTAVRGPSDAFLRASPDGSRLYLSVNRSGTGFGVLDRDPMTGAVSQPAGAAGCTDPGGADGCTVSTPNVAGYAVPLANGSVLMFGGGGWERFDPTAGGFVDAGFTTCPGCLSEADPTVHWSPTLPDVGYVQANGFSASVALRDSWPTCTSGTVGPYSHVQGMTVADVCRASTGETPTLVSFTATLGSFDEAGKYVPHAAGTDDVTLTVAAGGVTSTFPLSIIVVDSPPSCGASPASSLHVSGHTPVGIVFGCGDPDGDNVALAVDAPPAHGSVTLDSVDVLGNATYMYTPDAGYIGADAFSLAGTDTLGETSTPVEVSVAAETEVATIGVPKFGSAAVPREGTYKGLPVYFSWLDDQLVFTASADGPGLGTAVESSTTMNTGATRNDSLYTQTAGTRETYTFYEAPRTSSIIRVASPGTPRAIGEAGGPWSAGLVMRMAMPIFLEGFKRGHSLHITADFGTGTDHAGTRGKAVLQRLSHKRWKRVKTLRVSVSGRASFTVSINGARYRVLFTPTDPLDLDGSYFVFKAAIRRGLASAGPSPVQGRLAVSGLRLN